MADENVNISIEGGTMEKIRVVWQFNPITVVPIIAAIVGGSIYVKTLEWRLDSIESSRSQSRIEFSNTLKNLDDRTSDLPYRMKEVEVKGQAMADRQDRLADLVMTGQEATRKAMQDGFDAIRKDMSVLSTKVEVVGSKVDMMTGKPQPGVFLRPK
jgi:hypothetical protein